MKLSKEQLHEIYVKYELMGSFWFYWVGSWISSKFAQDLIAKYYAKKTMRKFKRFTKLSNWIFEYDRKKANLKQ